MSSLSPNILLSYIANRSAGNTKNEIFAETGSKSSKRLSKLVKALINEDTTRELIVATAIFVSKELK